MTKIKFPLVDISCVHSQKNRKFEFCIKNGVLSLTLQLHSKLKIH